MEYIRSFFTWVTRVFDQTVNAAISIGRQGFERIRWLGRTKRVLPVSELHVSRFSIFSSDTDIAISVEKDLKDDNQESSAVWEGEQESETATNIEDFDNFFRLPFDIRMSIYEYLSPNDILTLRLINKRLRRDVSLLRGVHTRVDDFRRGYEWIRNTGIESVVIENFTEGNHILKYPGLLKELIIKGRISPGNLHFFLQNCYNLEVLEIEFEFNIHSEPTLFTNGLLTIPAHLKTLRIICPISFSPYSTTILENVNSLLAKAECLEMTSFTYKVVLLKEPEGADLIDQYHLAALRFIQQHAASLKKIDVDIKQLTIGLPTDHLGPLRQDVQNEDWTDKIHLTELELALDSYMDDWLPLFRSQRSLRKIELNIRGWNWAFVIPIIATNCGNTLQTLTVMNIFISWRDGETRRLNLELLRDCNHLETLTLHHQQHTELFSPTVSNSGQLPQSLKELSLAYFVLKAHQELEFLLKLPSLEKLELGYWSQNEYSLASFLTTLSFLIKLDLTNVNSFVLTGLRRKFDNRSAEILRLTEVNKDTVKVFRDSRELEAKITIQTIQRNV